VLQVLFRFYCISVLKLFSVSVFVNEYITALLLITLSGISSHFSYQVQIDGGMQEKLRLLATLPAQLNVLFPSPLRTDR